MRITKGSTLGLALVALTLSTAACVRGERTESSTSAAVTGTNEMRGTVREKRSDELRISDDAGREHTIHVNETTQVFVGDRPASGLGEVPEGAQVRASFPAGNVREPAIRIDVVGSGEAPVAPDGGR